VYRDGIILIIATFLYLNQLLIYTLTMNDSRFTIHYSRQKIGIFGGAFNPPHGGHIDIIEKSITALNLDKIVVALSVNPPHKSKNLLSLEARAEVLTAYFNADARVVIDETEKETGLSDNFTYQTLPLLKQKYGNHHQYFYIMGGDSFLNFNKWKHPELIVKEATLAVVPRKGFGEIEVGEQAVKLPFECNEISSSAVRAFLNKVKEHVSNELFSHCWRVAVYALRFAKRLNLSFDAVFTAAMLHDIAKEAPPFKNNYPTNSPKVWHQYHGAEVAETVFNINDSDILDAIKFHTTAKQDMTNLQKLIYAADKLEPQRFYTDVYEIRTKIEKDFEKGFTMLLARNVNYLKSINAKIDTLTMDAYKYYTK
jgi:nicotinate-nucleotide adenylyltransferase